MISQNKRYYLLILYVVYSFYSFAQSSILQNPKESIEYTLDSLNTYALNEWKRERYESTISVLLTVLDRNQEIEDNLTTIKTCNKLGFIYLHLSDFSHSYSYFKNALEISTQEKRKYNSIYSNLNIAFVSLQQNDAERTLSYLKDVLSSVFSTGDSSLIKRTYGITALYYEKTQELDKALTYYHSYESISYAINEKHRTSVWRNNMKDIILDTETNLLDDKIKFALYNLQLKEKDDRIIQVQRAKNILISGIIVNAIVLIVLIYFLIDRMKANKILNQKNTEIEQQQKELLAQKDKLSNQNKKITSSINYALTIQNASLPDYKTISQHLDFALFYRPKDIVSGDFYWFHEINQHSVLVAIVDSTGHGVPGAFMSLIGIQLLNEIVIEREIHEPAEILDSLNKKLSITLKQNTSENDDGMDVCLCRIEKQNDKTKVIFGGAKRPLYHYSKDSNSFVIIKGNPSSTGGRYAKKTNVEYKQTEFATQTGDLIVLSSDGLIDQPLANEKKYGSHQMLETIKESASLNPEIQIKQLIFDFESSLHDEGQRDDISVMIIKM